MRKSNHIDTCLLNSLLKYDAETGVFCWKVDRGPRGKAGAVAGCDNGAGYWHIQIDGKKYKAHRLAWVLAYGVWPEYVDHINANTLDNRLCNLRAVSHAENHQNRRTPNKNTKACMLGVDVHNGMFRARITKNGKQTHIGYFPTAEDAHAAYVAEKRVVHPFGTL